MITLGSVSREQAASRFPFLAGHFPARRGAIKEFTHAAPDFVFWIYPEGTLFDAQDAHRKHVPPGFEHILKDEPDYGGFLRGRLASNQGEPVLVVYCRQEALASDVLKIRQFLRGVWQLPVPLDDTILVISDNGDIYGTISDIELRYEVNCKETLL